VKIVHFSDWHGELQPLPIGDLYVCTGDMLPSSSACMSVDREPERRFQREWIDEMAIEVGSLITKPAPLVVVRGNHDYIDLAPFFREWRGEVHELLDEPRRITINGLSFGGFRGV